MGTCMSSSSSSSHHHQTRRLKPTTPTRSLKSTSMEKTLSRAQSGASDLIRESELHRLQDRMFINGSSRNACLFAKQGGKGANQDAMIVWENFASRDDTIFCGVFDGHGPHGHMVAKKVRDALPLKLFHQWEAVADGNVVHKNERVKSKSKHDRTDEYGYESLSSSDIENVSETYLVLRQSLVEAFKMMDIELKSEQPIDSFSSGTTATTFVKQGHDLIIANLGDSRAVLATRGDNDLLVALQLTVDLKPNIPEEAARISKCKGRVFAHPDEPDVARVWLPHNDSPGLAMARALGDFCLKDYGLISFPDVSYRQLTDRDEFIVLATDGVWDVLSNDEVVEIIASAPTRATAAKSLVNYALEAWQLKFPSSKTDDCAVVCLFLHASPSAGQEPDSPSMKTSTEPEERVALNSSNSKNSNTQEPVRLPELLFVAEAENKLHGRCLSPKGQVDKTSTTEEEWSALDGLARMNSLMTLPKFTSEYHVLSS